VLGVQEERHVIQAPAVAGNDREWDPTPDEECRMRRVADDLLDVLVAAGVHRIQGVMDAHRSGAPVLALAAHIPSRQIGTGYFQETKPEVLFAPYSHYCETIAHPDQVGRLARAAVQNAAGKQGAAVLVLPGDILAQHSDHQALASVTVSARRPRSRSSPASAVLAPGLRSWISPPG
jgi:Thiamine pyrophosphate enzyme, N-terminal TPP binding domain